MKIKKTFHGGCLICTMQNKYGIGFCTGCQFFDADWSKPDLSDNSNKNFIRNKAVFEYETIKFLAKRNTLIIIILSMLIILKIIHILFGR